MSWAIEEKDYSQRRACGLAGLAPKVYRHRSRRSDDGALRAESVATSGADCTVPNVSYWDRPPRNFANIPWLQADWSFSSSWLRRS